MSSSASSAIAEWEVTKNQGGLPRTMVRSSGMPAAMIDLPAVHEVFGPPEDKDILVVDIVFLSAARRSPTNYGPVFRYACRDD
jgi:hypothetical protein